MSGKGPSRQDVPPKASPHSRPESTQKVLGNPLGGSLAERPKEAAYSRLYSKPESTQKALGSHSSHPKEAAYSRPHSRSKSNEQVNDSHSSGSPTERPKEAAHLSLHSRPESTQKVSHKHSSGSHADRSKEAAYSRLHSRPKLTEKVLASHSRHSKEATSSRAYSRPKATQKFSDNHSRSPTERPKEVAYLRPHSRVKSTQKILDSQSSGSPVERLKEAVYSRLHSRPESTQKDRGSHSSRPKEAYSRPHSRPESTQRVRGSYSSGSPTERPKGAAHLHLHLRPKSIQKVSHKHSGGTPLERPKEAAYSPSHSRPELTEKIFASHSRRSKEAAYSGLHSRPKSTQKFPDNHSRSPSERPKEAAYSRPHSRLESTQKILDSQSSGFPAKRPKEAALSRLHSRPESTQKIPGSHSDRSLAELLKETIYSRSRTEKSTRRLQRTSPRDSPQAQSSGSWEGSSPTTSLSPQAGRSKDPSGNSASTLASTHSTSSRGTGKSIPRSSNQSTSSRSPDNSTSSTGSSYRTSSSRSPVIFYAKSKRNQGVSSRSLNQTHFRSAGESSSALALKQTHPKSAGESSSTRSTARSPSQSSHAKSAKDSSSTRSTPRSPDQTSNASPKETALKLKQTHPKLTRRKSSSTRRTPRSPGESSSTKSTPRSPGHSSHASSRETAQSSQASSGETASKGEHGHSFKSKRRIHHRRRHQARRKGGTRSVHISPKTSSGSEPPSYRARSPPSHSSDSFSSLGKQQQLLQKHQQVGHSHRSANTFGDRQPQLRHQTARGEKDHEHGSSSKHPRQKREHRAKNKHDMESDALRRGSVHGKLPFQMQARVVDQDGRKPVPLDHEQTPPFLGTQFNIIDQDRRKADPVDHGPTRPSPHQVRPRIDKTKGRQNKYENFDEMMRVQRRQSLLSQKLHSGKAKLVIGLPISKRGKHGHTKSRKRRRDPIQGKSLSATTDAQSGDLDVFARPIFNVLFETKPSKSTAAFHRRASVIANLVRIKNWRDGSKIFRPSEFGMLNKKVSDVSGDPFLDPSCSLFINNELFESEAPDPTRKHGPVFVALPIPSSGVILDPREALFEAGWVKSHPNDPIEKTSGIARSRKSNDQLKRALHETLLPAVAIRRDGQESQDSSRNNFVQEQMDQDSGAAMKPRLMQPDHKASGTFTRLNDSSSSQPPESNEANQTVILDLWSQDMEFDPTTTWQQQAASVSSEGRFAPPSQDTMQDNQVQTYDAIEDNQFQPSIPSDQPFGFQTDQQIGDGISTVSSFGEQYAGSVQDPGFSPPQDLGFNGPQTPNTTMENETGILMRGTQGFTFDSYARMNFSSQPTGIWPLSIWKRVKIDVLLVYTKASQHPCAPVSSWQDPLGEPLLRTMPYKLRRKALAVFAHLMAYMGDVPTRQSSTWHVHQILSAGIRYRGLRDEIFCQIIKQTTANPSRLSNTKGWQAMAICCGIFLPSENFYPYLDAHLEQVAGGTIARQGTADQLGQYVQGMVNPLEAAVYSLERLRKVKRIGPRRLLPLPKEIEVVETMDTIPTEVALPDGTSQAFILRPIDTSEEVVEHLVNILGLLEARSYGLYQVEANGVEKLIASNSFILEVQASCNTVASTPHNIQDIRFAAKTMERLTRLFCGSKKEDPEDNNLATVVLGSDEEQYSEGSLKMLLKRKLYLVDLEGLPEALKAVVLAFEYSQAVHDIVSSVHIVSEGDAMMLGAMQLRAELGTSRVEPEILAGIDGSNYGPQYCVQGNEGVWKDAIATTLTSLPYSEDVSSWKQDYIDYVKSRCPLYEACMFFVKPLSNFAMPKEMYLAVNSSGVSFVNANSKEAFNFLGYAEIASWGYTPTVFSVIAGSMTINADTQFQTMQGLEISNTIQMYVDLLQGVQQRTTQAQSEKQAQPWDQPQQFVEGAFESIPFAPHYGYQTEEMMQPQQPEIGESALSLDPSFLAYPPLQAPDFWEQPIIEGQEEQHPWPPPPLPPPPPFGGQPLSSAMSGKEQQAWSPPPPPQPPEEPVEKAHKHSTSQLHHEKDRKNRDREEKKHSKQKQQLESATSSVVSEQGGQILSQPIQQFSTIRQTNEEESLPQNQVEEESEGSKRKHRKHRKHKKRKHHKKHAKVLIDEKPI